MNEHILHFDSFSISEASLERASSSLYFSGNFVVTLSPTCSDFYVQQCILPYMLNTHFDIMDLDALELI